MTGDQTSQERAAREARWLTRAISLVAAGLFVLFMVKSGLNIAPLPPWSNSQETQLFLALGLSVSGILITWRSPAIGGFMAVVGTIALLVLVRTAAGPELLPAAILFTLPLVITGGTHLAGGGSAWARGSGRRFNRPTLQTSNQWAFA